MKKIINYLCDDTSLMSSVILTLMIFMVIALTVALLSLLAYLLENFFVVIVVFLCILAFASCVAILHFSKKEE